MSDSFPSLSHLPQAFPIPTIPDDVLHYVFHLPANNPSLTSPAALALQITQFVESLLPAQWIWNKDPWELKLDSGDPGPSTTRSSRLEGRMRVGDAVDDEWCAVWLLQEVSREWPELVIR